MHEKLSQTNIAHRHIAREIGGLGEIVQDSGGGVFFSASEDLARQLELFERDRKLGNRLGEAGHSSYRRNCSAEVHIERYLGIIHRIKQSKYDG